MNDLTKPHQHRLGWFYRWSMAFLGLFDRWLHLSCRAFIQVASEKYDRPLSLGERIRQALHRTLCRVCRIQEKHMDQIRVLARELAGPEDEVGATGDEAGDVALSEEARARIREAIARAAGDTSERESGNSGKFAPTRNPETAGKEGAPPRNSRETERDDG